MEITIDAVMKTIQKDDDTFFELLKPIIEGPKKYMSYCSSALNVIETKLKVLNDEFSFAHERNPIDTIEKRIKDADSLRKKLRRMGFKPPGNTQTDLRQIEKFIEENIHDIAGIRVICPFIDDVYMLADCLARQDDIKPLERKDYIARPKESGYRSLHLIIETPIFLQNEKRYVKVEIQLRTIAMDFWANLEHRLQYKKNIDLETAKRISAELFECAETSARLDLKMQSIRDGIDHNSFETEREKTA
ncbi:GTP pyrophosphokinase [Spirochaetia bacterium]|nr:GTP pyrophosphokinase [Spirochaetia bacterium]